MKSKLLNLLAVSLTSSILIAPAQGAFAQNVEPQQKINESQLLIPNIDKSSQRIDSKESQNYNESQESKTETTPIQVVTDQQPNSSQLELGQQTDQVNTPIVGVFIAYVVLSYISIWLVYKKRRAQRAVILLQQIEKLERIWKMESRR